MIKIFNNKNLVTPKLFFILSFKKEAIRIVTIKFYSGGGGGKPPESTHTKHEVPLDCVINGMATELTKANYSAQPLTYIIIIVNSLSFDPEENLQASLIKIKDIISIT